VTALPVGGAIGDVYLATAFKNHDRRIPIPGFDTYGVGATDAAACPALRAAMVGMYTLSSVDPQRESAWFQPLFQPSGL
jgi:hypothetical protein